MNANIKKNQIFSTKVWWILNLILLCKIFWSYDNHYLHSHGQLSSFFIIEKERKAQNCCYNWRRNSGIINCIPGINLLFAYFAGFLYKSLWKSFTYSEFLEWNFWAKLVKIEIYQKCVMWPVQGKVLIYRVQIKRVYIRLSSL